MSADENRERRVRLRNGPESTSSSVILKDDGSVVVELYDFSGEAESHFGNDVAFLVTISAADVGALVERLGGGGDNTSLLDRFEERFGDYFEVVRWLDENAVPYRKEFDSWA